MKQEDLAGATIDRFAYDTPTYPQEDFYALCDDDKPLVMVFLPNYGHPISRVFLTRYIDTLAALRCARLACVVHSEPQVIAKSIQGEYPFTLVCDAGGVLYDYFNVESTASRLSWSFEAARIFRQAAAQGFQMEKGTPQQLPLTLIVGRGGVVLFSHYGQSLTDMPEDCAAIERMCVQLLQNIAAPRPLPDAAPALQAERPAPELPYGADFSARQADTQKSAEEEAWDTQLASPVPPKQAAQSAPKNVQPAPQTSFELDFTMSQQDVPDDAEEQAMDTLLEPMEEPPEKQPPKPQQAFPDNPQSWNRLIGLFADNGQK